MIPKFTANLYDWLLIQTFNKNTRHYVWPETDPVKGVEAPCSLEVVGKEKIVKKGDGEPDEVGAEEEELSTY